MPPNNAQIKEYEMLRNEQLHVQERIHKLYTWGIAGMAVLWGFAINNHDKSFSFTIALVPAICTPFLFLWARDLAYTGYRISKYIREKFEPIIWEEDKIGWESWVKNYRESKEKPAVLNPWSKEIENGKKGRLAVPLYNILFLFTIPLSVLLSTYLAFGNKLDWSLALKKFLVIVLVLIFSSLLYLYLWRCTNFNRKRLEAD